MAITQEERDTIRVVQLLFGKSSSETKEFFESVGVFATLQYSENKEIIIPFLGTIKIQFNGDKVTAKGKEAQTTVVFEPSPFLIRNVGQIEDGAETDAEKILISRFRSTLQAKEQA